MDWIKQNRMVALVIAVAIATVLYLFLWRAPASAADLGGTCCADLEERIAELEATTARKGNRKLSLTISGQINKALLHVSGDGESDQFVIENSAAESLVRFEGAAKIAKGWAAGYVLEIGVGGFEAEHQEGFFSTPVGANGLYTRKSYWFIDSPAARLSVGLQSQATDGIAEVSTVNTGVVARTLSLRPINGPQIGEFVDLFDGTRADAVRVDSTPMGGFVASASWTAGSFGQADVWDVALRYRGEGAGFRLAAGIGYRDGVVIPTFGAFGDAVPFLGANDVKVASGSVSLQHMETGLFVNGAYGRLDATNGNADAWHVQAGDEKKWNELGKTTLYGEYGKSNEFGATIWGAGVVQSIDAAAMDLYLTGRRVEFEGSSADLFMAGARVLF